jgi:hypothetical protein
MLNARRPDMFAGVQSDFTRALLDPELPPPDAVTSHTARRPQKRFAVYRNNVVASLINALRAKFPATERIVGAEFFAAMARVFISAHPPRSKILHAYGDDLGDFIAAFAPAAGLPYLADVARLEASRTRAYHAADAMALGPDDFAALDPRAIGALRLTLHPSLQIVRSRHPVVTIWGMNAGDLELGPVDDSVAEDALVLRPGLEVTVRSLPAGGAAFLIALAAGATLAGAADKAMSDDARFDLTVNLAGLFGSGAVTAFATAEDPPAGGLAS